MRHEPRHKFMTDAELAEEITRLEATRLCVWLYLLLICFVARNLF